jgi:Rrf2 family protein
MLSKACQYAIKALIYMGTRAGEEERSTVSEVSKAIGSPPAFTSKILQKLVSANMITSAKGGGGGFQFSSNCISKTTILSVAKAMECDSISEDCILGLPRCSDRNPCPVHHRYAPLRKMLTEDFFSITIGQIIQDRKVNYFKFS